MILLRKIHFAIFFLSCHYVFAANETPQGVVDCTIIFEQRKAEILKGIEKIDEQQQALQALQSATQAVLDQKQQALNEQEREVNATMEATNLKEEKIKKLIAENEEILKAIKKAKDNKIAETYTNMKDSKAAPILEGLPNSQAATILFNLEPKVMSKVLAKMTPARAAELTRILQKGPPFVDAVDLTKTQESAATQTFAPSNNVPGGGNGSGGGAI
ncbi:PDP protein [Helicobacter monodelphidis]|uniref:MotE family protein n=1 Tax=Helicobacter sp. 15-1451 TaxID=2004995 RepID=UPI000DCC7E06|nr:MotE family protein [Helicobacter sp. 15-1451]RAX57495.1 PDP protein [Helicobacter sp. 15-1451]